MARGRPAAKLDSSNEYLGATPDVAHDKIDYGDAEQIVTVTDVGKSVADHEAFMQDVLTVIVQASGADNEAPYVFVSVNGAPVFLPRDEPVNVKRMYVEVLARCKKTDFDQVLDERMGEQMNRLSQRHSLKHPFTVVYDPNPTGHQWLREILAQRR